jgi:SAM-dependent methyltransferase
VKNGVAERIASLYDGRSLQGYARWKVRMDVAYATVAGLIGNRATPLVDIGCGIGLLPFYLRESGHAGPIIGLDFDDRKIEEARRAARRYRDIDFVTADARNPLPVGHDVIMLDVLQYLHPPDQLKVLANIARAAAPSGVVIIRQGIADGSWRHRASQVADAFGRVIRWMRAERLRFPTKETIVSAFEGFDVEIRPLWGRTPFNNYLFIFRGRGA